MASHAVGRVKARQRAISLAPGLVKAIIYALAILFGILTLFPFFWAVSYSLRDVAEVFDFPPPLFPPHYRWINYVTLFQEMPFALWIVNSVEITVLATLGTVISATLVAYSFARFRYPGRNVLFFITIGTLILPNEVTIVPTYLIWRDLGSLDTFRPLIVPSWLGGGAFFIFLLRQFLLTIPRDFDDAAKMDGASSLRILISVIVPFLKPALLAVTVISFIGQWDDFFNPLIYLNTPTNFTVSLGLNYLQSSLSGEGVPEIQLLMVAATLATLPPLLLFVFAQRYFIEGVVLSGIKG